MDAEFSDRVAQLSAGFGRASAEDRNAMVREVKAAARQAEGFHYRLVQHPDNPLRYTASRE